MQIKDLPFTQRMQIQEANVRGTYISIACDFERILCDITTKCEITEPAKRKIYREQKIMSLEMGKKIERTKKALKKYRNEIYYIKFLPHFNVLTGLVYFRNMMAHGYADFDQKQLDNSFIIFQNKVKRKMVVEKIFINTFLLQMDKYRSTIMKLVSLAIILNYEIGGDISYPHILQPYGKTKNLPFHQQ